MAGPGAVRVLQSRRAPGKPGPGRPGHGSASGRRDRVPSTLVPVLSAKKGPGPLSSPRSKTVFDRPDSARYDIRLLTMFPAPMMTARTRTTIKMITQAGSPPSSSTGVTGPRGSPVSAGTAVVGRSAGASAIVGAGGFVGVASAIVGLADGAANGTTVGGPVGATVGATVGASVATDVRAGVGATVGAAVGARVGTTVEVAVGATVGATVCARAGTPVGAAVGATVGATVGASVGTAVGTKVGAAVGSTVTGVGASTVTLESPRTGVSSLLKSLRVPEKVWEPGSPGASTVYVKEVVPCRVNLTCWPVAKTCPWGRLLDT